MARPGPSRGTVFELNAMISKLEALKQTPAQIVKIVQGELDAHVQRTVTAQTDAYGEQWIPGKYSTELLKNARSAITYTIIAGSKLRMKLTGRHANHHHGAVRGGRKRRIIPHRTFLPPPVVERLVAKLQATVDKLMEGASA